MNLKVLQQAGVRISALRNLGARAAAGDILAFLDADCLAPADWLDRIFALAAADGAGVLGAHYLLPEHHRGWEERGIAIRKPPKPEKYHTFLLAT